MKVLFVGQTPLKDGAEAFSNTSSGKRLNAWIEYLGVDDAVLMNAFPGGGKVTLNAADKSAIMISILEDLPDRVIALGSYAHQVLNILNIDHFHLPHPSGRNRKLNDKTWVHAQLGMCRSWLSHGRQEIDYVIT